MFFNVVSSGSKGNATLVFSHGEVIQIDFGISKRKVTDALRQEGFAFEDIEAFFITHTHSDHVSEVSNAPVEKLYVPQVKVPKIESPIALDHRIKAFQTISVGVFKVTALPLSHDCPDTMGYVVEDGEESLVVLTDTGFVPEKDFPYLKDRTYYVFESNHDPKMLYESKRPDYLIRRIISDTGHLSNTDCALYLSNLVSDNTKEIVLAHLSDECNTPEIAMATFEEVFSAQLGYLPSAILRCASDKHDLKGGNRG